MATQVISLIDNKDPHCEPISIAEALVYGGLQVLVKSEQALKLANKIIEDFSFEDEALMHVGVCICYDCHHTTTDGKMVQLSGFVSDEIRRQFEINFGSPELENSKIEWLGYDSQVSNPHWSVWSQEVKVDEDGNIVEWIEY